MGIKHKVCINIAKPGGTPSPVVRSRTMQIQNDADSQENT